MRTQDDGVCIRLSVIRLDRKVPLGFVLTLIKDEPVTMQFLHTYADRDLLYIQ